MEKQGSERVIDQLENASTGTFEKFMEKVGPTITAAGKTCFLLVAVSIATNAFSSGYTQQPVDINESTQPTISVSTDGETSPTGGLSMFDGPINTDPGQTLVPVGFDFDNAYGLSETDKTVWGQGGSADLTNHIAPPIVPSVFMSDMNLSGLALPGHVEGDVSLAYSNITETGLPTHVGGNFDICGTIYDAEMEMPIVDGNILTSAGTYSYDELFPDVNAEAPPTFQDMEERIEAIHGEAMSMG